MRPAGVQSGGMHLLDDDVEQIQRSPSPCREREIFPSLMRREFCCLALVGFGSPVLFWRERIGRRGRRFLLEKFRARMAPYNWRGDAGARDDRLSPIGRFIRRIRLDEIRNSRTF